MSEIGKVIKRTNGQSFPDYAMPEKRIERKKGQTKKVKADEIRARGENKKVDRHWSDEGVIRVYDAART
jgi:hypothetical protein